MTFLRPPTARVKMLALLALAGAALCACSPQPAPSPTPTAAFASDEEAFAAAEALYREYNDAGNTNADTSIYLTGSALESDISTERYLTDHDLSVTGESEIIAFDGTEAHLGAIAKIHAQACLDVSASRVVDSDGTDVTPSDRDKRWLLDITVSGTPEHLSISKSVPAEDASC